MSNDQIHQILEEKRAIDKENMELDYKIQGRGDTAETQKIKQ